MASSVGNVCAIIKALLADDVLNEYLRARSSGREYVRITSVLPGWGLNPTLGESFISVD